MLLFGQVNKFQLPPFRRFTKQKHAKAKRSVVNYGETDPKKPHPRLSTFVLYGAASAAGMPFFAARLATAALASVRSYLHGAAFAAGSPLLVPRLASAALVSRFVERQIKRERDALYDNGSACCQLSACSFRRTAWRASSARSLSAQPQRAAVTSSFSVQLA